MQAKKRLVIVHRFSGSPEVDWYPWVVKELLLTHKDVEIIVPSMPNPNMPTIEESVKKLEEVIGTPDENSFLVGHSIGCQQVLRYLEKQAKLKASAVGGVLGVGAWFELDQRWPSLTAWIDTPIVFSLLRSASKQWHVLLSDDDPYTKDYEKNVKLWRERLGAEVTVHSGGKHFNAEREPVVLQHIQRLLS